MNYLGTKEKLIVGMAGLLLVLFLILGVSIKVNAQEKTNNPEVKRWVVSFKKGQNPLCPKKSGGITKTLVVSEQEGVVVEEYMVNFNDDTPTMYFNREENSVLVSELKKFVDQKIKEAQ